MRVASLRRILAAAVLPFVLGATRAGPFVEDPRRALREARDSDRPLLVVFHTAWCEACERMSRTTWRDPGVLERLGGFVALAVDAERTPNLVARYGVDSYPTIVIAEPSGQPILELTGYQGEVRLGEHLDAVRDGWPDLRRWAVVAANRRPDPAALLGLADFARLRQAHTQAERLYRRALRRAEGPAARLGLAEVLVATGRCREAARTLARVGAIDPGPAAARADALRRKLRLDPGCAARPGRRRHRAGTRRTTGNPVQ